MNEWVKARRVDNGAEVFVRRADGFDQWEIASTPDADSSELIDGDTHETLIEYPRPSAVESLAMDDKQIVIYRGGWGFLLPDQHVAEVASDGRSVSLSVPDRGGTYDIERVDDSDPYERRIYVSPGGPSSGHALGDLPRAYPFPTIDEELDRLRARWIAAGGPPGDDPADREGRLLWQRFNAGGHDSHDEWTGRMRRMIREL